MLLEHVTSVPHLRKHCSVQALAEREKGIGGDTLERLRSCLYRVSSKGLPNAVSGCLWTTPMPERERVRMERMTVRDRAGVAGVSGIGSGWENLSLKTRNQTRCLLLSF